MRSCCWCPCFFTPGVSRSMSCCCCPPLPSTGSWACWRRQGAGAGGAVMVLEKDSSGERLYRLAREILADEPRRKDMGRRMAELGSVDAAERIYAAVMALGGPK